jgi:hypothetical protein
MLNKYQRGQRARRERERNGKVKVQNDGKVIRMARKRKALEKKQRKVGIPDSWKREAVADALRIQTERHQRNAIERVASAARKADREALDAIATFLTGREWTADTLSYVAELIRATGRTIADVD